MTKKQIIKICVETVEEMRAQWVPRKTGNMAFTALRYEVTKDGIVIGVESAIAPYAPYTEYPWTAERWHGKKNPNEGWWERFREELAQRIARKTGGTISYV